MCGSINKMCAKTKRYGQLNVCFFWYKDNSTDADNTQVMTITRLDCISTKLNFSKCAVVEMKKGEMTIPKKVKDFIISNGKLCS